MAIIEQSLDGITSAAYAAPYPEPAAIVNRLRTDIASPIPLKQPISKVIFIRMNKAVAAGGDMVIIDHGTRDGFKVGDVLLTARPIAAGRPHEGAYQARSTNAYLGQLWSSRRWRTSATCRILRSTAKSWWATSSATDPQFHHRRAAPCWAAGRGGPAPCTRRAPPRAPGAL